MTILIEGVTYKQTLLNYSITESPVNPCTLSINGLRRSLLTLSSPPFWGRGEGEGATYLCLSVHNIAYKVKRFQSEFKVNL